MNIPRRNRLIIYSGLFCAGYVHAVCQVLGNLDRRLPFSVYLYGDAEIFLQHAREILSGRWNTLGQLFHPPAGQWFMAGVLRCAGILNDPLAWKYLLGLQGGVIAVLTAVLADRLFERPSVTMLAGAAAAFSFGIGVVVTVPGTEALYLVVSLASAVLLLRKKPHGLFSALVIGVLTGLAALTRQEHLVFILAAAWFAGSWKRATRPAWRPVAMVCAGFLLVLLPATVLHYRLIERINRDSGPGLDRISAIAPVTIYGPLNFALANMPPADGEFTREALPRLNGQDNFLIDQPLHRRFLTRGYRMGWDALRADPDRAVKLAGKKLAITCEAFSLGWTAGDFPAGLRGVRRPVDLFAPAASWPGFVFMALTVAGLAVLFRRNPSAAVLFLVIILHRLLVVTLFFGYVRQGILLVPYAVILSASVLAGPVRMEKAAGIIVLILAATALIYDVGTAGTPRNFEVKYDTLPGSDRIDQQLRVEFIPKP